MKTKIRRLASLLLSIIIVSTSISFSPFTRMDVKAADWIFIDHIDWQVDSSFSTANIKNDGFSIGMYSGNNQSDSIISVSDFLSEFGLYLDSITGSTKNWFTSNAASSTCYPAYVYKEAGLPNSDNCIVIYYGSWGLGNEKSINPLDKSEMSCWLRFCMVDINTGIPYVVNMYYRSSSELNDSTIAISYDENTIEPSNCVEPNDELYSNCKLAGRVSSPGKYHANIESLFRYIYGETSVNNMVSNMNNIENTLDKVGTDLFSITSKRDNTKVTFSIASNDTAYTRSTLNGETSSFNDTCEFVIGGSTNDIAGSTTASNDILNSFNNVWNANRENEDFLNNIENGPDNYNFYKVMKALYAKFETGLEETYADRSDELSVDIWDDFHIANAVLRSSLARLEDGNKAFGDSIKVVGPNGESKTITIEKLSNGYLKLDGSLRLDKYQHDSLMVTYSHLLAVRFGPNPDKSYIFEDFYNKNTTDTSSNFKTSESDPELTEGIVSRDEMMDAIEEFETYTFTTSGQDVIDVARLSSTLMKYAVYMSTTYNFDIFNGNTEDLGFDEGEEDGLVDSIPEYNYKLHSMLDGWSIFSGTIEDSDTEDDGRSYKFTYMPSKVGAFENGYSNLIYDAQNGADAFNAIQKILYADSYVFEALNSSEFGTANNFDVEHLAKALEDPDNCTGTEYEGYAEIISWLNECKSGSQWSAEKAAKAKLKDTTNVWIFRCIIELHDTCELLNIDPEDWSKTIADYCKLYEDYSECFDALRKSPYLYGTGYTGGATVENPLGIFFSVQGRETSEMWNIGFANSALYVPMVTNLYDASIYEFANEKDNTWISEFLYKYGFHRKALYISTDPNIVVNNKMNKSSDNGLVPATLRDLINYERDIQLYIDTGFYNSDDIESAIGRVDYATLYQYTHDKEITTNVTDTASEEQVKSDNEGAELTFYNENSNNFIDETLNLDAKTLLKDDDIVSYSVDVAKNVTKLGETATDSKSLYDGYVLSADALTGDESVFSLYNYTPMTAYAVVSAIYRDVDIYNELATVSKSTRTVFSSSRNIIFADGTTTSDWLSYMNYLQLANLENQMNKNVESQLDLDSPIFIDIFGNIVTESGFVIIPAASNATICGSNWTPYTIGFGTYMTAGNNEVISADIPSDVASWLTAQNIAADEDAEDAEASTLNIDSMGNGSKGGWFVYTRDGKLKLKNVYLESYGLIASVNWDTLNANSDVIQEVFWNNTYFVKAVNIYGTRIINIIVEVLRGAPIENIDYEEEGITGVRKSDAGIVIAYALDRFLEALSTKDSNFVNSMTTMPNLAFMPYLKYVIYFGIKITLALFILIFLVRLFMSGVRNKLGFKEVMKLAFTIIVVVSAIYILPNSITWSYDKANSTVLSTEAEDMLLYSTMRKAEGQQIGITEVSKIDENTQLLVQVDTVNPSWSKILGTALLSNEYSSFTELFDDALSETPYYGMAGVVQKGSNVYIDIGTIMDSTRIAYSKTNNTLYNKNVIRDGQQYVAYQYESGSGLSGGTGTDMLGNPTKETQDEGNAVLTPNVVQAGSTDPTNSTGGDGFIKQDYYAIYSFTSPYYVILDQLIANVNEFNQQHEVQTYTASIDSEGKVVTYDIAAPYLVSEEFMTDGYDILGLTDALQCERQLPKYAYIFDEEDKANIKASAWYPEGLEQEEIQRRIAEVYNYARSFIVDHKQVIKHIPDEQLLKVLAFACAVKYNQVFHCPYGDSIKLITVDNRDMMRFMLSDFNGVYSNVAYSFGRYVYQTSGTIGVILAAILCVIILITTVLKPLLIWALFIIIIINIMFRELLFDKPNQGVEGYFIGCALFMCFNFIYAGAIKACFSLADSNLSSIAAMVLCIVVQILYLVAIGWLIYTQISDWKNGGYRHYAYGVNMISSMFMRNDRGTGRRRLDGTRTHAPASPIGGRSTADVTTHPSDEPQGVYITQRRNQRRNRTTYNGPLTLDEMHERDEERESSRYRR